MSIVPYLKTPEVHNYRLTESKLQAYDRIERRILSAQPTDPIVKAMLRPPPEHASLDGLAKSLENTPLKPLIESNGMTVKEWFIIPMLLRGSQAADAYYEKNKKMPGYVVSLENITFYVEHRAEIKKMMADWSALMTKQEQAVQQIRPRSN